MFPNPECLTSFIVWFFYLGFTKIVLKDAFWLDFGRYIKLAKIKVQNCNICSFGLILLVKTAKSSENKFRNDKFRTRVHTAFLKASWCLSIFDKHQWTNLVREIWLFWLVNLIDKTQKMCKKLNITLCIIFS